MDRSEKSFAVPCIKNKKTMHELFVLAYTDQLTQCYNRNMLEEFRKELDTVNNKRLFVTIVDIDGLKEINDTYGHLAGDDCIKQIALTLSKRSEVIFRLGGDEFLLFNPEPIYLDDFAMISYGSVERELYEPLASAMHRADMLMYQIKRNKKRTQL